MPQRVQQEAWRSEEKNRAARKEHGQLLEGSQAAEPLDIKRA